MFVIAYFYLVFSCVVDLRHISYCIFLFLRLRGICDRVREKQPYVSEIDFEIRGPTANSG